MEEKQKPEIGNVVQEFVTQKEQKLNFNLNG